MALTTPVNNQPTHTQDAPKEQITVTKTIGLTPSLAQRLDDYCHEIRERSVTKVIRKAIEEYLDNNPPRS